MTVGAFGSTSFLNDIGHGRYNFFSCNTWLRVAARIKVARTVDNTTNAKGPVA